MTCGEEVGEDEEEVKKEKQEEVKKKEVHWRPVRTHS